MKVTTPNVDTLNRALIGAPQPNPEYKARYGEVADRLWRAALVKAGIITVEGEFYTYDSEVLQDACNLVWATAHHYFLSDVADFETLPAQGHSDTSVEAAISMVTAAENIRSMVYEALVVRGMTDLELAAHLGLSENTVRPRRVELYHKGLVESVGKKKTPSNRMANIWGVKAA